MGRVRSLISPPLRGVAVARDLREAIQRGDYPPGSKLPGENDIMRDHGVARMTARQALAQLTNERHSRC